jgi:hypothetical protein
MAIGGFGKRKKVADNWPKKENGEPINPAFLKHIGGSQMDIELTLSLLDAYGIPAVCQYPNNGEFGRLMIGHAGGGIDIFVPETLLDEAKDIISAEIVPDVAAEEFEEK